MKKNLSQASAIEKPKNAPVREKFVFARKGSKSQEKRSAREGGVPPLDLQRIPKIS